MVEFDQLVSSRRSATNFIEGIEIKERDLEEIFGMVKMAPSAFNLQHANYIVVRDPSLKEEVREAAHGQYKVKTASAAIIVLGDKKAYEGAGEIYSGLLSLGIYNKQQYDHEVESVTSLYESLGDVFQRDEAIRNASLSAMLFMLAAKSKGWDTCPMIGYNPKKLREVLSIPDDQEPVMMITIGKEKVESRRPRGYRKPVGEFVKYM